MQYMMLIYLDENSLSESQRARCYEESAAFARELQRGKAGEWFSSPSKTPGEGTGPTICAEFGSKV